jgi:transposase
MRDRAALEVRRLQAARLLERGVSPAEVSKRLGVSRTSVWRWAKSLSTKGRRGLRKAPSMGRREKLTDTEKSCLMCLLKENPYWRKRANWAVYKATGKSFSRSGIWRLIKRLKQQNYKPRRNERIIRLWKKRLRP